MRPPDTSTAAFCAANRIASFQPRVLAAFFLVAILFFAAPIAALAQANSTNIVGVNNVLQVTARDAAIIAGSTSTNGATNSAILGAANASLPAGVRFAFIGAGNYNFKASGSHSGAMLGGYSNSLSAARAAVVGGAFNSNAGRSAAMLGGEYSAIAVNATGAVIVGGISNLINASAVGAVVAGGSLNSAEASGATVLGGHDNQCSGTNSFCAGTRAFADKDYSFVWGGSADIDTKPR